MTERFNWSGAAHALLRVADRMGVARADVLHRAEVDSEDLPPVSGRIAWDTTEAIARAALALTREPGLGLLAGAHCSLELVGLPGLYYLHVSPARASQLVAYEEVWPRLTNVLRFHHEELGGLTLHCGELLEPRMPYDEDLLHLQLGLHLAAYRGVFGDQVPIDHIALRSTRHGAAAHLSALVKCEVRTGQPGNWLAVP
ncbi:MAG TPA: AraC family transcriptional regulator ligand-binding domain-containing protein, partial [bacterium]